MKSRWIRCRGTGIRRPTTRPPASTMTWRCASIRRACWAAIRGWCCMAAAIPRSRPRVKDQLGEEVEVICIKGSGWDMGNIEPLACRRCGWNRCAIARAGQALRRGHGQLPADQSAGFRRAQSVGRNPAARLPAAQIYRPRPFHRRAGPDRPARWRGDGARGLWRPHADVPYIIPGFALAKVAAEVFDDASQGRRPGPAQHGIFTFGDDAPSRPMS